MANQIELAPVTMGSSKIKIPLFPALNGEKELSFLLGIARSVYSIRTAQNIYENAIGLDDVSYNGLRKVAAAMDVRVA